MRQGGSARTLGEGGRSAGEPLVSALLRWSARDRSCRCRCAAVLRAARASSLWPTHVEAVVPPCQDARPHRRDKRESRAGGTRERGVVADKARMRRKQVKIGVQAWASRVHVYARAGQGAFGRTFSSYIPFRLIILTK
jgi:hypothetical protein